METKIQVTDGMVNYAANLGTARDKASHSQFVPTIYTEQQLLTNYRQSWACGKIVDIPARDSTRAWRSWQAKADQITKIEALEKKHNLQQKVEQALIWGRLFGGAAIYIGTNRAADPSKPLGENEQIKYLRVLSRRELSAGEIDYDLASDYYGQPAFYRLNTVKGEYFQIHPSRLVRFIGRKVPDAVQVSDVQVGWGDSVLASCMASVMRAESTMANVNSLVFEAKVDVVQAPDLAEQMADPAEEAKLLQWAHLSAMMKGINGMLLLDKEMDYSSKSASFGGLPELIEKFLQEIAGASDIPVTRLLGQSPGGMNSTGESDLRNYYDRISSEQNLTIGPELAKLDELLIRTALGSRPAEIHYNWNSLWQPTAKEQAEIGKMIAETIDKLNATGLFNADAMSKAATNAITEKGVLPGLEAAMNEASIDEDEDETDQTDPLVTAEE